MNRKVDKWNTDNTNVTRDDAQTTINTTELNMSHYQPIKLP